MSYLRDIIMYAVIVSIPLGIYFAMPVEHDPALGLWIFTVVSFAYLTLVFVFRYYPRGAPRMDEESIRVDKSEIAHFYDVIEKALKENPVAQREVEMKLLEMVSMELSLRYEIPEKVIRYSMSNEAFLSKYLGEAGKIVADFFNRRHELTLKIPRERFLTEVEKVMEAMR